MVGQKLPIGLTQIGAGISNCIYWYQYLTLYILISILIYQNKLYESIPSTVNQLLEGEFIFDNVNIIISVYIPDLKVQFS